MIDLPGLHYEHGPPAPSAWPVRRYVSARVDLADTTPLHRLDPNHL
ncbi:hypothetical protein BC739_006704 [Kutzneria viridogrisea]|uniref:Uncharacterized protein n=1 Tax=Kutzneria viridogrisea TaxID=47990 RepID=A0ABR6BRD6_9PSEU|nr:hypothetical protein [Kutzneria viridogrisea]